MKKLMIVLLVLFVFSIPAYAQMGSGMMGSQQGQMGQGMMGDRPMMDCPMQQMSGQGMMKCGQQGMMGGMMGMGRERMGHHRQWFHRGVTLLLQNADKLKLSDEQIEKLYEMKRKYSKDIIKQDAEMKIAEIDLEALLKESEINLSEVKEALKKVENIKTQIKYLKIVAFVEARKILTDEQKKSLKKLMKMRLGPRMRGMMSSTEPEAAAAAEEEEEEEAETPEEEAPTTDPHGH